MSPLIRENKQRWVEEACLNGDLLNERENKQSWIEEACLNGDLVLLGRCRKQSHSLVSLPW
jgi:hypothetical protein